MVSVKSATAEPTRSSQPTAASHPAGPKVAWHAQPAAEVMAALTTVPNGLGTDEVRRRLGQFGPNTLEHRRGDGAWRIFFRQLQDPLIYVLLGSTLLAILTGKVLDGAVIGGVVVLNALIGFVQEYRANRAIQALAAMVPTGTVAWRDGRRTTVPAAELVPGDVVELAAGDRVPADVRLIETRALAVEEAALTGESMPVAKGPSPAPTDAAIAERTSMAFNGTLVRRGTGNAVVVATGHRTELGRISTMLEEAADLETPLTRKLGVIARWIAWAVVAVSVVLLAVGIQRGYPLGDAILAAVTLAVAAIPEGLPAIVTIALAVGVQRMARRNAIMRRLPAVETLGSTTVICSDKTGTLTRNEMTVQRLWAEGRRYRLTGIGYVPRGALTDDDDLAVAGPPAAVEHLLRAAALCNDAALARAEDDAWALTGDPTEGALVVAAAKLGIDADVVGRERPRLDAVPFASERQYMATLHHLPARDARVIYLKGAPEVVLQRCSDVPPLLAGEIERMAAEGLRVLAVAERTVGPATSTIDDEVGDGFRLLGVLAMIDPPRGEAIEAVALCRRAGIVVKMITGDHQVTARAIGEALGLGDAGVDAVAGRDLDGRTTDELRPVARRHDVFARVAPEHKLALVRALQAEGHVVAMTGDGVNDAPALKQANIGIAMGITGTAASKEAADMVLADDNFASIAAAVQEGRRVYDNLVKALAFVLPTNLGLALILIAAVGAFPVVDGAPVLPMEPVQVLWINLVAAVALALPLALEAREADVMLRPPRQPEAPVLDRFVLGRTINVAMLMTVGAVGLFVLRAPNPDDLAAAQTQAVTAVVLFQIFYLLECRSLTLPFFRVRVDNNPWLYGGSAVVLALQLLFVYAPFMQLVFGSAPLSVRDWLEAGAVASVILPIIALEKAWRRPRAVRPDRG